MKREICCDDCARHWLRSNGIRVTKDGTIPESKAYSIAHGETIKQVRGAMTRNAMCDGCNMELPAGTVAVAVSLYSHDLPYFSWEDAYIVVAGPTGGGREP